MSAATHARRAIVRADEDLPVVVAVVEALVESGFTVDRQIVDWPEAGTAVGEAVASGSADVGVCMCWTGTGVSIAANKVGGVRAALCTDAATARGARQWNDANVLALGMRLTTDALAREIVQTFVGTPADEAERSTIDRVPK